MIDVAGAEPNDHSELAQPYYAFEGDQQNILNGHLHQASIDQKEGPWVGITEDEEMLHLRERFSLAAKHRGALGSKARWAGCLIIGERLPGVGDDFGHGRELKMNEGRIKLRTEAKCSVTSSKDWHNIKPDLSPTENHSRRTFPDTRHRNWRLQ